jgi:hypothetical protein
MLLAVRQRLWFQHDGARVGYGVDVQQWLNTAYAERLTGHRGPIAWHPLLSCGGHLKEHVYAVPLRTIEVLLAGFQALATSVDVSILRHIREHSILGIVVCVEVKGGRFEHVL